MLSVGIIGLPNVGKSTLFNALTAGNANVSNYPFTTIDSNLGVVPVPDVRLEKLRQILNPKECTPCFIQFIDIAGLVEGANRGEGLGNQFLGNIRQVDALAHVVRCFQDPNVAHVLEEVDPARDIEIIETELLLADLEVLNGAIEKRVGIWKTNPRDHAKEKEQWLLYREKLEAGIPLGSLILDLEDQRELKGLGLLTGKPVIYVINLSEEEYPEANPPCLEELKESQIWQNPSQALEVVTISARFEWELQQLDPEERAEFEKELGITETGLQRLVKKAFKSLGLITFYTIANEKLRAWEVEEGTRAPEAAGKIHSDMERGFIRAQVVSFEDLLQHGSFQELNRLGLARTEGKDYQVKDSDVIQFAFRD
ncbi:redox-regulated ATPase YchF [Acidobacteria bacterium AH-259-A15]|nr:redox-regulated ATPase YchF [Acidobacteria bacterium AH-259-A15]